MNGMTKLPKPTLAGGGAPYFCVMHATCRHVGAMLHLFVNAQVFFGDTGKHMLLRLSMAVRRSASHGVGNKIQGLEATDLTLGAESWLQGFSFSGFD